MSVNASEEIKKAAVSLNVHASDDEVTKFPSVMGVAYELETLSFFSKMHSLFILCLANNIPLSTLPTIKIKLSRRPPIKLQESHSQEYPNHYEERQLDRQADRHP